MREPEFDSRAARRSHVGGGLEQRVLGRIRELHLPAGSRIIVGFSGGSDSLALLRVLASVAPLANIVPVAVHVDHGLRPESAAEQAVAARIAAQLGVRFHGMRIDPEAQARHHGLGTEEAARRERYRLLADAARAESAEVIALAHHQTDQAETVLLHLLRGAGLAGAAAMAGVRHRRIPWWDDAGVRAPSDFVIWRPLLDESKSLLLEYVSELGLPVLVDPSNRDVRFRRNAIRHQLLPMLEEIQPGATAALARHAALIAADDDVLAGIVAALLPGATADCGELKWERVASEPVALQRRIVRSWLTGHLPGVEIGAARIEDVRGLALGHQGGKIVEIGAGYGATNRRGLLQIVPLTGQEVRNDAGSDA